MRLDKFIKMTRLIKRRTLAKELCDLGGVLVNHKQAKASYLVKINDEIELHFGNKLVKARVLEIPLKPAGNLTIASQYVDVYFQERRVSHSLPVDDEELV
jgi:ribosomal 50S subunit-recycling heat shock protein